MTEYITVWFASISCAKGKDNSAKQPFIVYIFPTGSSGISGILQVLNNVDLSW